MRMAPLSDVAKYRLVITPPAGAPGMLSNYQKQEITEDKFSKGLLRRNGGRYILLVNMGRLTDPPMVVAARFPREYVTPCTGGNSFAFTSLGSVRLTIVCYIPSTSKYPHMPSFSAVLLMG